MLLNKYDSCEAYVMQELQDANSKISSLEDTLEEYRAKNMRGELGPELDPMAYKINRPVEVVYADIANRYTMYCKDTGFGMTSEELFSYLESDEKLKELSEKKIGYGWCKEPAMSINTKTFPYSFEDEQGRKILLGISSDSNLIDAEFLHDIEEDFNTLCYYPIEQKDEVEKSAMIEFRSRVEQAVADISKEEGHGENCES